MSSKDLISALQAGGVLERRGEFELDREKARKKLQKYRLSDPQRYVLELVQAAHLLGATAIRFRIDTDEMEMTFDGTTLAEEDLQELYAAAFSRIDSVKNAAMRHIAIGLTAARELEPVEMIVESGGPKRTRVMSHDPETGEETVEIVENSWNGAAAESSRMPLGSVGTRVYVRVPRQFEHIFDFFRNLGGEFAEKLYIRRHCLYSDTPIFVNGARFNRGLPEVDSNSVRIETAGEVGVLSLLPTHRSAPSSSSVKILQNGVLISTHYTAAEPVPYEAIVDSRRLTKDLSQSAFVEDDAFDDLLNSVLEEARYEAILKRFRGFDAVGRAQNHAELTETMRVLISKAAKGPGALSPTQKVLMGILDSHPMWFLADKVANVESMSLGSVTLIPLSSIRDQPLRFSTEVYLGVQLDNHGHVLRKRKVGVETNMVGPVNIGSLATYLGKVVTNVTSELRLKNRASVNKARWEMNLWSGQLGVDRYPTLLEFKVGEIRVQMGIANKLPSSDGVSWVKDGRLLGVETFRKAPIAGLQVSVVGPLVQNEAWDAPKKDDTFNELVTEIVRRVPELLNLQVDNFFRQKSLQLSKQAMIDVIYHLTSGSFHHRLFKALDAEEQARGFLQEHGGRETMWALRYQAKKDEDFSEISQRIESMGDLAGAMLFPRLGNHTPVSLKEIASHLEEPDSRVATVHERHHGKALVDYKQSGSQRFILLTSDRLEIILLGIFGSRFLTVSGELRREVNRVDFMTQARHPFSLTVRQGSGFHHKEPGLEFRGGLNLDQPIGTLSKVRGGISVRVLHEERVIDSFELPTPLGHFKCVARGTDLNPRQDFTGILKDHGRAKLVRKVKKGAEKALHKWMRNQAESEVRQSRFWEFFREGINVDLGWIRDLKIFTDVDGVRLNTAEVARRTSGRLVYVEGSAEPLKSALKPGELVLRNPYIPIVRVLFRCKLENVGASAERRSALLDAERSFMARTPRAAKLLNTDLLLVRWPLNGRGIVGEVELQRESLQTIGSREVRIELLHLNRIVQVSNQPVPFGKFRAIVDTTKEAVRLDVRWSEVFSGLDSVQFLVAVKAEEIMASYLSDLATSPESRSQVQREMIWRYLKTALQNHDYVSVEWPDATEALFALPILQWTDNTWATVDDLLERNEVVYSYPHDPVPADQLCLVVWDDVTLRYIEMLKEVAGLKIERWQNPELKLPRIHESEYGLIDTTPDAIESTPTSGETDSVVAQDAEPHPDSLLTGEIEALLACQRTLIDVRGVRRDLLSDQYISTLSLSDSEPGEPLVSKISSGFGLNQNHPVAQMAMEPGASPAMWALFVSGVYSDLNRYEVEVTNRHEVEFQSLVADWLERQFVDG